MGRFFKWLFDFIKEHKISAALIAGFIVDNLTFTRIDLWWNNLILVFYLVLSGIAIVIVTFHDIGKMRGWFGRKLYFLAPLAMQYAFGGLFSGFFIFYSRSSTLVGSWPFILVLVFLFVANEVFKARYLRFVYQVSIYFTALFSFLIFYVPVITKSMGVWQFLLSGVLSLILIKLFTGLLSKIDYKKFMAGRRLAWFSIISIYLLVNFFYFTNIIPPIPLSLKDAGIYHSVVASGEYYTALREEKKWYQPLRQYDKEFHKAPNEFIYFYSAVFAPTDLNTEIVHSWQYYDGRKLEWVEADSFTYEIVGGRDGGYRGYSRKLKAEPGRWRVDVTNTRGQLLGRIHFDVIDVDKKVELESVILE